MRIYPERYGDRLESYLSSGLVAGIILWASGFRFRGSTRGALTVFLVWIAVGLFVCALPEAIRAVKTRRGRGGR